MNSLFHPTIHFFSAAYPGSGHGAAVGAEKHSLASLLPPIPAHSGDTLPFQRQYWISIEHFTNLLSEYISKGGTDIISKADVTNNPSNPHKEI